MSGYPEVEDELTIDTTTTRGREGGREGGRTWVILPIMALTAGSSVGSNTRKKDFSKL